MKSITGTPWGGFLPYLKTETGQMYLVARMDHHLIEVHLISPKNAMISHLLCESKILRCSFGYMTLKTLMSSGNENQYRSALLY